MIDLFENLDKLFDVNLEFIAQSSTSTRYIVNLRDTDGKEFELPSQAKKVAQLMEEKNLVEIDTHNNTLSLTTTGLEIINLGGWLKYIEISKKERELEIKRIHNKERKENIKLNTDIVKNYIYIIIFIISLIINILFDLGIIKSKIDIM